jgi:hypothetical protein
MPMLYRLLQAYLAYLMHELLDFANFIALGIFAVRWFVNHAVMVKM